MSAPEVCIVLATYDGAAYLGDQLESIQAQTFQNWELLIRDDGSEDTTSSIIDQYCSTDPRIKRIDNFNSKQGGPKENFSKLLTHALNSPAGLFMFSDQDDYWHPTKIQTYFDHASKVSEPCLFFSNLELVDSELLLLDSTYSFETALNTENATTLASFLSLNHIPGCCIAINRELAEIASPIPETAIMHDWWLALTAAACGKLLYIDQRLLKYRQHQKNTIGASPLTHQILSIKAWPDMWKKGSEELCQTMQQANELAKRLDDRNTRHPGSVQTLFQYAKSPSADPFTRLKTANQLSLRKGRGILRLVLYLRLLLLNCSQENK